MKTVEQLKSEIGFKTAFKATLGFYAAKVLVGIIGSIALLGLVLLIGILSK
jgi:hypothetical protein